jgi:hypothetical protein
MSILNERFFKKSTFIGGFWLCVCSFSSIALLVDAFAAPPPAKHAALTRKEVESILDSVPVFAVTEPKKEGLVLLSEKGNENDVAYFFLSPDMANSVYAPLRKKKEGDVIWEIAQFSLGVVWFELFQNPRKGVEYRLVPDSQSLDGARRLLAPSPDKEADVFKSAYNEIPLFVDQSLRVQGSNGEEKFPMYFSLQDLVETCQQAQQVVGGEYTPTINVADFCTVVEQMQLESENDFRSMVLIPPSLKSLDETTSASRIEAKANVEETFSLPMGNDQWDD